MPESTATAVAQSRSSPSPSAQGAAALAPLTLILGGARSGKSAYAEGLFAGHRAPIYVATAQGSDSEMDARIAEHRARRGAVWTTVEVSHHLAAGLISVAAPEKAILVDCLTLWLSNLMGSGKSIEVEIERLISALPTLPSPVVFVSNEVGLGIVPDNALARQFRDHAGRLNQRLAQLAQRVVFVAAGLPLILKDEWK